MEAVVELALEFPFELGMIEVSRMKFEVVGMYGNRWILELNDDFHRTAFGPGREIEQGMLVEL